MKKTLMKQWPVILVILMLGASAFFLPGCGLKSAPTAPNEYSTTSGADGGLSPEDALADNAPPSVEF